MWQFFKSNTLHCCEPQEINWTSMGYLVFWIRVHCSDFQEVEGDLHLKAAEKHHWTTNTDALSKFLVYIIFKVKLHFLQLGPSFLFTIILYSANNYTHQITAENCVRSLAYKKSDGAKNTSCQTIIHISWTKKTKASSEIISLFIVNVNHRVQTNLWFNFDLQCLL